jgi:hypothetical protein
MRRAKALDEADEDAEGPTAAADWDELIAADADVAVSRECDCCGCCWAKKEEVPGK